jgi:excisionase family DNA binding protein
MSALDEAKAPEAPRQPHNEGERLALSVEQASRLLGISTWLGYELVGRGELPSVRLGRRIVVPRAALERMLENASPRSLDGETIGRDSD